MTRMRHLRRHVPAVAKQTMANSGCVVGCTNRDKSSVSKRISFYLIPKIILHPGEQEKELSSRR